MNLSEAMALLDDARTVLADASERRPDQRVLDHLTSARASVNLAIQHIQIAEKLKGEN